MSEPLASVLNRENFLESIDADRLRELTTKGEWSDGKTVQVFDFSALFASVPVFITEAQLRHMTETVHAVEMLVRNEKYGDYVLADAPSVARFDSRARGVFFGYDFHLDETGPKLIEVNTNAGGAMLNLLLGQSQRIDYTLPVGTISLLTDFSGLAERILVTFETEWALVRPGVPLRTIAIVDDEPAAQFLYPEFLLFQRLFQTRGYQVIIADPLEIAYEKDGLFYKGQHIDLIYNRLVDFYLADPKHVKLREAYLENRVVLTPHPRAYALYADKRNLVQFRDAGRFMSSEEEKSSVAALLANVPETQRVSPNDAEQFWSERKKWFFKPIQGYGSKAAYRGDKLTKGTFLEILERDYIAQRIVPPGERRLRVGGNVVGLKYDVRCFVYDGQIQLLAARLYQGQTTNFRTPGGGFAPVYLAV
jgi:glutathione synthase/RimK-type ligase-like ATP-grasp enzyme